MMYIDYNGSNYVRLVGFPLVGIALWYWLVNE